MIPADSPSSGAVSGKSDNRHAERARRRKRSKLLADGLVLSALFCLVIGAFWKTVFLGRPISRLAYIADWDSFMAPWKTGASQHIDPSAVLLAYPAYSHIAKSLHSGVFPLWNSLNGCGAPLIGDIQTTLLSPFHWLFFLIPTEYIYNLQLVLHVFLAAAGGYALGRALNCRPLVALLPATAFAFCPYFLWYLELQTGQVFALYPLLLALFVSSANRQTPRSAVLAGVGAGLVVISGHPECAFFAVFGSTAFLMINVMLKGWGQQPLISAVKLGAKLTLIAGAAAVCVAAPVLLPFIEFLKNSDCYKFATAEAAFVPWQGILYSFLAPGFGGASPYVGVLCASLIPFAFRRENMDRTVPLVIMAVFCIFFCAKIFPMNLLLSVPPFSYLITVYCLPLLFLALVGLAGLGLQALLACVIGKVSWSRSVIAVSIVITLCALCIPLVLKLLAVPLAAGNFDLTIADMHVDNTALKTSTVLVVAAIAVVLLCAKFRRVGLCALGLVALNLVSVGMVGKNSLPSLAPFKVPTISVYERLRKLGERSAAVGHVANPNTNELYGFSDVRCRNALWSLRYLSFMRLLGGNVNSYEQQFAPRLLPALDLASVRYVISSQPVTCTKDAEPETGCIEPLMHGQRDVMPGLRLVHLSLYTDRQNRQANGYIQFACTQDRRFGCGAPDSLAFVFEVRDRHDQVVWFSDRFALTSERSPFNVLLPPDWINKNDNSLSRSLSLNLRLVDTAANSFLKLDGSKDSIRLCTILPAAQCDHHFQLVDEMSGHLRLYENKFALPQSYLVFRELGAETGAQSLDLLTSPRFDCRSMVIIEEPSKHANHQYNGETLPLVPAEVKRPNDNEVVVTANAPWAGSLVLTDTYFPGWNAYLDGKPAELLRANYFFRAVRVPAGAHTVVFKYQPLSFAMGLALFSALVLFMVILAVGRKIKVRHIGLKSSSHQ